MEYSYYIIKQKINKRLHLGLFIIAIFSFSAINSQTLNYTIDTATGHGDDTITETLIHAGDTYVLTVFHEGGVGSTIEEDDLGSGDKVFYLSAEGTGGDYIISITKNGNPIHFTLNSLDYDTLETGDISLQNQDNEIIADQKSYSTGAGAITITNTSNATNINSFNIISHNAHTTGGFNDFAFHNINVTIVSNVTWTGATNNDWNTDSNWNINSIPVAGSDVVIPSGLANYPLAPTITVNTLTIESGASLQQNGDITGAITFKRNLATTNWYLIASPVVETIEDFRTTNAFATGTGKIALAPYDNTQATAATRWNYQTDTSTGSINIGEGYSVKLATSGDLIFTGNAHNTTPVTKAITIGAGNAFNLLGNPYLGYYHSNDFLTKNTALLTSQTIWVWNQATNSYDTKVTADNFNLAPGQGFFVECGTAGNVEFLLGDQSHSATDTFQRGASKSEIHLQIVSGEKSSKTKFYYIDGTTKGFDNGYDGKMFSGTSNSFAVYSQLLADNKGENYAIQSLPKKEFNQFIIPLGLNVKASQEIVFSMETKNIPEGTSVYLEDRLNNKFINLSESTYTIALSKDANGTGQFYLHTDVQKTNTSVENDINIYKSSHSTLTITGLQEKASLKIFSILGKEILHTDLTSNGVSNVNLPSLATGVYIVELSSEKRKMNKKIILK